ncbi:response regulator [Rubripirellula amarantea]|uniref:Transcriptional regulatory protein TdiR n=1 Tax=Rubripirellula amarantea TaxID=2527999 RepID=A0A5C5WPS1_9BACT|nr:response regulator [Rubripirellula amarantea]MDA8746483.1 response regulator [Rubripirellula amarantea]TWT52756.1 Transcriptional regulatory protein TdiR [Rubripirellula amarantea]
MPHNKEIIQDMLEQVKTRQVYLVDDSPEEIQFVERICESVGVKVRSFSSAESFLDAMDSIKGGCVLIDMLMPGMNGLSLFEAIKDQDSSLTCILMTGFGDTASCRAAFRAGIFDFIEKDAGPREFLDVIERAFDHAESISDRTSGTADTPAEWEVLTQREKEVAEQLVHGFTLKKIASILGITVQTASKHRSRVFDKLGVASEVELLKSKIVIRAAS